LICKRYGFFLWHFFFPIFSQIIVFCKIAKYHHNLFFKNHFS
jgi:hypothetical protein